MKTCSQDIAAVVATKNHKPLSAVCSFAFVIGLLIVPCIGARADVLEVQINGINQRCPTTLPTTYTLGYTTLTNSFNCVVTQAGYGTFLVTGTIMASNRVPPNTQREFEDNLQLSVTVTALSPVGSNGAPFFIDVQQDYQVEVDVPDAEGKASVMGSCNSPRTLSNLVYFFVDAHPNVAPEPPPFGPCPGPFSAVISTVGGPKIGPVVRLNDSVVPIFLPGTAVGDSINYVESQTASRTFP